MNTAAGLIISRGWMSICAFVTFVLVARNLSQAEFGVFALASSASILPQMLVGAGFYEYVIGRDPKGRLQRDAESWAIVSGAVGAVAVLVIAAVADIGFKSPAAALLLAGFAAVSLLWGFSVIREATLIRDGRGGAVAGVLFCAETAGLIVLVWAFESGAGVFALLAGRLANAVVTLIGFLVQTRRGYALTFDLARGREMFGFIGGAIGARVVRWARGWGSDLAVGMVMPLAGVGLFRMGMRLFFSGSAILLEAPQPAILKYLGRAHERGQACMRRTTVRVYRLHALVVAPIFIGGAAISGLFVHAVLGPGWAVSGVVFAVLCLSAPTVIAMGLSEAVMLASGRSNALFVYQAVTTVLSILALTAGGVAGPIGAALARVLIGVAIAMSVAFIIRAEIGVRGRYMFLSALARALIANACMAIWTLGWMLRVPFEAPLLEQLGMAAFAGATGLAVYFAAVFVFDRPSFRLLIAVARLLRRPRRRQAATA